MLLYVAYRSKHLIMVLFALFICLIFGWHNVSQLRGLSKLYFLVQDSVEQITIDGQKVADPQDVEQVVTALNKVKFFSSDHGGWTFTIPFTIAYVDGSHHEFGVSYL